MSDFAKLLSPNGKMWIAPVMLGDLHASVIMKGS